MNIQQRKPSELKAYSKNNKMHPEEQISKIARSIKEFGFNVPILLDSKGVIIAGHGRLLAAEKLGLKTVPCVTLDQLTPDQAKAYRIMDNRSAESEWEWSNLKQDFSDLLANDFPLELTGFDYEELKEQDVFTGEEDVVVEDDFVPPEDVSKVETSILCGEVFALGEHLLMCGDATSSEDVGVLMGDEQADMVLTDPPYGIKVVKDNKVGADFGIAKKGTYSDVIGDDTTNTAKDAYNILINYSNKLIFWGGNYFTDFLPFSDGWLIWDKRVNSGIRNTFADGEMAWCSFHTPIRIYHQLWNGMIREGESSKRVHPTQKPLRVCSEIINDFSDVECVVLDVFGGSGSTLIACEQTKRRCRMMELDPQYCQVIINRWEEHTGQKAEKVL